MPFFSVIIPSYNREQYIVRAIESVLAQEFSDLEIIVVDDGSTDNTIDRLAKYGNRIKILRQRNQGPGTARNLGVNNCVGEYIAFLDSDDLWFPWTLATYARIIKEQGAPTLIAGALSYFHEEDELALVTARPLAVESFHDYFAAGRRGYYCGTCQMVVKRDAVVQVGGFADGKTNAEDHDLVMRLGTAAGFVHVHNPPMIAYRQHTGAVTRDLSKTSAGIGRLLDMEKMGRYPGGTLRRSDRRRILSQHVRPLTLDLIRQAEFAQAWALYRRTFCWNLCQGRIRYLLGFPFKAGLSIF